HDGGARACHAAGDAVVPRPGAILVLKAGQARLDFRVPLRPLLAAGADQTVADVEIRHEFLSTQGTESVQELLIRGDFRRRGPDETAVSSPSAGALAAGRHLQSLGGLIEFHAGGGGGVERIRALVVARSAV